MGKCCFCGKEINFISENDIRPIKTSGEKGFVCCNDCNSNIVIPTRVALARETGLNDQLILKMNDMLFKNMQKVSRLNGEKKQLKEQLALTEKALELACERVKYFEEMQDKEMGFSEFFGYDSDYDLQAIIEQYEEQAKEVIKSE